MAAETEVIACPACRHVVRVPVEWLGTPVQCPECRARFRAPVRQGDRLTEPELLAAPPDTITTIRPPADSALWLPAFGLMFVGFAGLVVNGFLAVRFTLDPDVARAAVTSQLQAMRQAGFGASDPEDQREQLDADRAAAAVRTLRWLLPLFGLVSAVVFAGGLAMALRRARRLSQVACVLAVLNIPHLCCVPGAVFGVWGLLMLGSQEGREHFA